MDKTTSLILVAIVALAAGFAGGYMVRGGQSQNGQHMMSNGEMMGEHDMSMGHAMDDMMAALRGKEGDEFDRTFLSEMIVHHQGAVDMAAATLNFGKHEELKAFSKKIQEVQTAEIKQMQDWQKEWYGQ